MLLKDHLLVEKYRPLSVLFLRFIGGEGEWKVVKYQLTFRSLFEIHY